MKAISPGRRTGSAPTRPSTSRPLAPAVPRSAFSPVAVRPGDLIALQRQAGNKAVANLVASWPGTAVGGGRQGPEQAPVVQRFGVLDAVSVLTQWAMLSIDPISIAISLASGEDSEMVLLNVLIANGITDKNKLSSAVFYARHPERVFNPLQKSEKAGQAEWKSIRATKVKAALKAHKAPKGAPRHVLSAPIVEIDADSMAAALANPNVAPVTAAVDQMNAKAAEIAKLYGEERGPKRDELVTEIRTVRAKIEDLNAAGLPAGQLDAVKAHFYRKVNAVSPFYEQDPNMDLLETPGGTRTCGITSFGMCLEALGKTTADYTGPSVANVAKVYSGKVNQAKDDQGGMEGLRLPDFVQLAAIAKCGGATGDVKSAMEVAWKRIKSLAFLADLASDFGVPAQVGAMKTQHASKKSGLRSQAETLHKKRVLWKEAEAKLAKMEAEADPKKAKERAKLAAKIEGYEAAMATLHGDLSPEYLDKLITVESFKGQVLAAIKPELDRGRQVINNMTKHYVRVESITEDGMISDDPGGAQRKDRWVTWEEGRAMAYFHDYLILG